MASNLRKRKETQKVKSAGGQVIHTADRTASGAVAPHQQRESNPDVREEFRKRVQESIGADMTAGVRGVLPTAQRAFDRTEAVKRRQSNKDGRLYITQHPERNLNPYAPKQPQQNPYAGGYTQSGDANSPEFNALARLAQQAGEKRSKRYADYIKDSAEAMGRKIDLPGFGMRYPGLAAQEYGKQHSDLDADTEYIRNKRDRNLSGASDAVRPGEEENEIFKGRGILAPNDRILQNAMLSDEQKRTYNYLYATQGAEEAEKFRDTALEEGGVNAMIAQKAFDADLRNSSYPGKIAATYIGGVEGAADSLAGVPGMIKGEEQYRPRSTAEYFTSEAVRSEPEGSLARTGLELAQSAGTNTLAHLASVAGGPALGSAVFAAQAGSRAYNESLMEGHTVGEATAYGAMQALDEEITNYLLGGLSAYGGGAVQRTIGRTPIAQMVGKELQGLMQTETGRYAMRQLMDAIASNSGEAAQEYLQHFTEEFEKWVAYNHTSYDVTTPEGRAALANDLPTRQQIAASLTDPEALHEALIGFLNAGLMNAPGQITEAADIMNRGRNSDLGNMGYGAFADAIDVNPLNYSNPDTYHEARDLRNLAQEYERRNTAGLPTSTFDRGIIDRAAYEFAAHAAEDPRQMARAAYDPYAGEIDSTTPEETTRGAERTPPAEEPVPETVEKLRPKEMQPEVTAPTDSAAKRLTPEEADAARARWNAEQAERKRDIPDRPYARDEVAYRQLTSEEADAARGELKRLQDEAAAYRADREARAASPRGETTLADLAQAAGEQQAETEPAYARETEPTAEAVTESVRPTSDIYGDYLARKAEYGAKKAQNDQAMSEALAGTFGKEGKKAFAEMPAERSTEAYREFAAYYNSERFGTQAPAEAQTLTPEQVTAAMKAGALDANAAYPADTMKATARSVQRIQVDGVNAGVADRSSINYDALTPQQKLRVDFTDAYITKGLGMDVRYIQSDAVNGNYEGINGSFSVVNGRPTITLDVNAGMNRESDWTGDVTDMQTMLPVISHEITHFLEKSAPEAYKAISDAVIKSLANNRGYTGGYTINQIVRAEMNRMDRTEKGADGKPIKHTEADALHEIVARACEDMLSGDTKAVQAFETLDTQTKATLWDHIKSVFDNIREFFQQMLSSYKSDSAEAKAIRQNMGEFERIRSMWQEALNGGTTTVSASEANTTQVETAKEAFSVRQFANSLDFDVRLTGEGQAYEIIDPKTGKAVKHVTPKMMEQTPMGVLVQAAFDAGTINKKTANKQLKMFSDLMNLTLKYDPGSTSMVWEIAGTYLFSSVKTNSDKQYSTTIDYGTICAKTQALIDVLSKTMVQKGRGLTREEVLTAYNKTAGVGLSVPCPVCYVFSRWMGVPSLLETMRKCQDRFSNASDKEVQDYIKSMLDEYKTAKGVNEAKTKVQNRLATLERRLQEALENGDSKVQEDVRKEVSELEKKMSDLESFNWVTQVRCVGDKNGNYKLDKGYRPVPNEILLDLTKSGDFAKQFPKAWKYRTTRGAGMGKAIVPYSGATLGDFIKGTKDRWASTKNPFFNKNPKAARAAITRAATRARAQNMIGGQRFQSTSDFRAEWGIDYLMTFLECQAAGSQVQLYTKVIEAVDMFASAGAEVNLSIMPKGDGYENGKLVFSDITGVNFENALEKTRQYDNVQMILVGINDEHIRMAMADDRITFIIPWHSSGNSKDTLASLMKSVGETLNSANDYSETQNDKIIDNSAEAKAARQLRKDIIQGKLWADYKNRKAAKLTDAQQAILDGNSYLKELYRKFYVDKSAKEYGVKLNGNQSAGIFPYEYWDTSLTIKDADQNGRRFQEYCASLGIQPRFPQFANDPGYWKTLIDRRMYNRDGTYHEPSAIDVTNVKIEQVPQAVNSNNYKDMDKIDQATLDTIRALDDRQSDLAVADSTDSDMVEGETQYANRDTTGRQLTNAQAEYFKDSKARDAEGRLLTLYHGTEFAGFTEFKTERGVWLTTSKRDADSYGGNWEGKVFDPNEKPEIRRTNGKTYPVGEHMRFETEEDRDNFLKEYPDAESYLTERELRVKEAELDDDWEADDYDERSEELQELRKRSEKIGRAYARYELKHSGSTTIGEMLEDPSLYSLNDFKRVWLSIDREVSFDDEFEYYDSDEEYRDAIAERLRNYIEEGADDQEWHDEMLNDFAVKARIPAGRKGEIFNNTNNRTYELYANVVNPYVFDNHGRGSEFNGSFYHTIEKAMADPQYDGVIVENARVGRYQDLGTVVLVKNPNQVKLTTNENPSTSNDVRFSQRGVDHDTVLAELVEKYGALPKGENPKVDVTLPEWTSDTKKTRRYARTVLESGLMTDQMSDEIKEKVIKEALSYEPMTDKDSAEYAASVLRAGGTAKAQKEWDRAKRSDSLNKDDMAVAQFLLKEYANNGDVDNVIKMVEEISAEATRMGQNIQSLRLLKKYAMQAPEVGLGYIQRTVDQMNRDNKRKMGAKYKEMKIDPALAAEYLNAKTSDEIDAALGKIYKDLGSQVQMTGPEAVIDKLRTWRYLSMLGNPRTHVRNFVGNAIFVPAVRLKNVIGAEIEKKAGANRTKALTATPAARAFAQKDALLMRDVLSGKSNMSIRDLIMEQRKVFKTETLNKLSKANSDALEGEDWIFLRMHYQDALAKYITANNMDVNNMDGQKLAQARNYAIQEAQKATYRDANKVSAWLNQSSGAGTVVKYMMEGMLPFKKTPTNILRRGVEYSPAGLIGTLTKGTHDLNTGKITLNEYIDGIASGLSGTAIFGVGMFLASVGAIIGGYVDDEDKERRKLRGDQEYAVRIGDHTYTVDWAAPGSLPLFIGVETMYGLKRDHGMTFSDITAAATRLVDPMINMSMLSGLNDTLDAISYSDDKLSAFASETFYSLLGQYVPTISGQIARTIDTTQRINYQDKNTGLSKNMLYFIEKMQNKIPYLTFSNDPYLNEFGQENVTESRFVAAIQNFISPGYLSKVKDDRVLDELDRLSETQDENVLPKKMPKYLGTKEDRVDLTSEQYTTFQRTAGQLSYNIIDNMIDDKRYRQLTAEEQAEAISIAYSYAKAAGRIEIQPEYKDKLNGNNKKVYNAVQGGSQAYDVILQIVTSK